MTVATLRVQGPDGRPSDDVTDALGLSPDARPPGRRQAGTDGSGPVRSSIGVWLLSSAPSPQEGVELAESLRVLLDRVEPVANRLWALAADSYTITWRCYLGSRALEHAAILDRVVLTRLLTLPGDLWLDVYPDDEQ